MPQSALCIDDQTLTQIFKGCPREFANLARVTQQAALSAGILDSPRDEYPLFEHLIIWLYARYLYSHSKWATVWRLTSQYTQTDSPESLKNRHVRTKAVNDAKNELRGGN